MIAVITYDVPHRKTQDLVSKLLISGYTKLHLVAIPFVPRKKFKPIVKHRPDSKIDISVEKMCRNLNIDYTRVEVEELNAFFKQNSFDHILIGGAGLLPDELVLNHNIINSHPGYLPYVRGLDALKWAIYLERPIGVTSHYIDNKPDAGRLIERREVPLYFEDTFHSLAYRVYETEIEMLVNAISIIESGKAPLESLEDDRYTPNRRMPHHIELIMLSKFEERRRRSPSMYEEEK